MKIEQTIWQKHAKQSTDHLLEPIKNLAKIYSTVPAPICGLINPATEYIE